MDVHVCMEKQEIEYIKWTRKIRNGRLLPALVCMHDCMAMKLKMILMIAILTHSAAPSVNLSLDSMGSPLIAGTNRSLLCSADSSTVSVTFTYTWMKNGSPVNINDSRVTVNSTSQSTSTLTINLLRTSDGGQYQCIGTIASTGTTMNITDEIDLNVTSEYMCTS